MQPSSEKESPSPQWAALVQPFPPAQFQAVSPITKFIQSRQGLWVTLAPVQGGRNGTWAEGSRKYKVSRGLPSGAPIPFLQIPQTEAWESDQLLPLLLLPSASAASNCGPFVSDVSSKSMPCCLAPRSGLPWLPSSHCPSPSAPFSPSFHTGWTVVSLKANWPRHLPTQPPRGTCHCPRDTKLGSQTRRAAGQPPQEHASPAPHAVFSQAPVILTPGGASLLLCNISEIQTCLKWTRVLSILGFSLGKC